MQTCVDRSSFQHSSPQRPRFPANVGGVIQKKTMKLPTAKYFPFPLLLNCPFLPKIRQVRLGLEKWTFGVVGAGPFLSLNKRQNTDDFKELNGQQPVEQ